MIGASECVRVAAIALAYGVAAMHASVEHDVDVTVVVTRDDHRLQADLARYVVSRFRNLTLMSDVYPFAIPNLFQFLTKDRGIVVYSSVDSIALNEILVVYFGGHGCSHCRSSSGLINSINSCAIAVAGNASPSSSANSSASMRSLYHNLVAFGVGLFFVQLSATRLCAMGRDGIIAGARPGGDGFNLGVIHDRYFDRRD